MKDNDFCIDTKNVEKVAALFQLISDPTRLKIFVLLSHSEECVNNIAYYVQMSAPAVSHHLRLLKQANLIEAQRKGKEMYYRLADAPEAAQLHYSVDNMFEIRCVK